MPKRDDIKSVLVIGSGPIIIGQACEFDYSGTQACRVLKEEGLRVVLVNSNPATIMTDPEFADATYIEPITPEYVEKVIAKERPDALLATLGGQTALNCAMQLDAAGVLEKYDVELIGASIEAINRGENRETFKKIVEELGGESARSVVCHTIEDLLAGADELGYPLVVRPSFTMGGTGSGFAYDEADLRRIGGAGLAASPTTEVLLEESILGWKEYELEVMRDTADNVVIICSIENLDPMGVHTGDSITVAPALTLTDREYQKMRDMAIGIIRAVGVDTGGCNIQYAVNPADGRLIVIEMNPRVSRSSALASKATGFPIAKIAAKVAIGYTLDEIPNDITTRPDGQSTPAAFEPTLDYVVVKVPRFAFEKFPGADQTLTTHMKSVGEAMAIGRNFTESLQKALRSLESKQAIFDFAAPPGDLEALLEKSRVPTDGRLRTVMDSILAGATPEQVFEHTRIDPWFVDQLFLLREVAERIGAADQLDEATLRLAKRHGFSDAQVAGIREHDRGRGARGPARLRSAPGLQDRRHLRRGVRRGHAVPLLLLRRGDRGRAARAAGSDHPRLRPEPDRSGHRVRLLLRARLAGAQRGRLRDRDGQLQPRDGLHRLRHLRPALLRAAHPRGRAGDRARRAAGRPRRRGHLPARRPDPAGPGPGSGRRRGADRRHRAGGDPPGRGARRVRPGAGRRRPAGAAASGWRPPTRTPRRSRRGSATRSWSVPPTCSAGAAWRSCTTTRRCAATSSGPPRSARSTRCWSTGSSTTRSRSTWTLSTTARSSSSAA